METDFWCFAIHSNHVNNAKPSAVKTVGSGVSQCFTPENNAIIIQYYSAATNNISGGVITDE